MGQPNLKSIIVLVALFSLSALLIHARSEPLIAKKSMPLSSALERIPGWLHVAPMALDEKVVRSLNLDDYISAIYTNGVDQVSLYIGYYLSSDKVGAAHDPLVCFPGQGWSISNQRSVSIPLVDFHDVNATMLVAELGQNRDLVLYWFQAYDSTNPGTFRQKLVLLWKKLMGQGQDNAFIRVTSSLDEGSLSNQKETLMDFVSSFYPELMRYVHEGNTG